MGATASTPQAEIDPQPPPDGEGNHEEEIATRRLRKDEELDALRADLAIKREARQRKLAQVGAELSALKEQLEIEANRRVEAEKEIEKLRTRLAQLEDSPKAEIEEAERKLNGPERQDNPPDELPSSLPSGKDEENESEIQKKNRELESLKEEMKGLVEKNEQYENQVRALKDVANIGKELLKIRECQVNELNAKLKVIEETGVQYEKEVATMRRLRSLYEERARAAEAEHKLELERERARLDVANAKLRIALQDNIDLQEKKEELAKKVASQDSQIDKMSLELSEIKVDLATKKEELFHASSQIRLVNSLLSQIISGPEIDLDRLAGFLEENHDLINEITTKGDINSVASTLAQLSGGLEDSPDSDKQEIASNLSKVWRILTELLSHHKESKTITAPEVESCYKSVETPKGPVLVISVSQTFIRLKDLILEKNALVKEVGRLRKLNCHLETRLDEQQSRLSTVTTELHSTWAVVNKLKTQHEHLHEHEMILRYELQQKRLHLNDLKKQLEKSRTQWAMAREKNSQTERDWKKLRAEFAMRKKLDFGSAESGYEDEQSPEDTDEEKSCEEESESKQTPGNGDVSNQAENRIPPVINLEDSEQTGALGVSTSPEPLQPPVDLESLGKDVLSMEEGFSQEQHRLLPPIEEVTEDNSSSSSSFIDPGDSCRENPISTDEIKLTEHGLESASTQFDNDHKELVNSECSNEHPEDLEENMFEADSLECLQTELSQEISHDTSEQNVHATEIDNSDALLTGFQNKSDLTSCTNEISHILPQESSNSRQEVPVIMNPSMEAINIDFSQRHRLPSIDESAEEYLGEILEKEDCLEESADSTNTSETVPSLSEIIIESADLQDLPESGSPEPLPPADNLDNFEEDIYSLERINQHRLLPPIEEAPEEGSLTPLVEDEHALNITHPTISPERTDPAKDIVQAAIAMNSEQRIIDIDKILEKREERLRRMESHSSNVLQKAACALEKGETITTKLDSLHETYCKSTGHVNQCSSKSTDSSEENGSKGTHEFKQQENELPSREEVKSNVTFATVKESNSSSILNNSELSEENEINLPDISGSTNSDLSKNKRAESAGTVHESKQKIVEITTEQSASLSTPKSPEQNARPTVLTDEILKRREERLKRMEESCKTLFSKMGQTSSRSDQIANKLDEIHAQYGEPSRKPKEESSGESKENESDEANQ